MAEFCLECWNKMNNTNYPAKKFILTEENDLCEGCGELKKVVIMEKGITIFISSGCFSYPLRLFTGFYIFCGD